MTSSTIARDRNQQAEESRYLERQQETIAAKRQVRQAFYLTMFLGVVASIASAFYLAQGDPFGLIDVAIIFGLGYGIYRYSEKCTQLMLGYYVICQIINIISNPRRIVGFVLIGFFIRVLWDGVVGASDYHRLIAEEKDYAIASAIRESKQNRSRDEEDEDRQEEPEQPMQPTKISRSEPLNPSENLIALCNGDRSQAQWLLSQVKQKNPNESVEWCNEKAIEQLGDRQ